MTSLNVSGLTLVGGGVIENGKFRELTDAEATALATGGENGVRFQQASGRGGVIKEGVVESEAYLSDLQGLANETFVNTAVSNLEAVIKGGASPTQDDFAEVEVITDALQAAIDAKPDDADIENLQSQLDTMNQLLASDDASLDTAQEWVDFMKNNKDLLDALPSQADVAAKVDQTVYDAFVAGRPQHVSGTMTGTPAANVDGEYEYTLNATTGYSIKQITASIDGSSYSGYDINLDETEVKVVWAKPIGSSAIKFNFVEVKNA